MNALAIVPVFAESGKYEFEDGTLVDAKAFDGDKDGNAVSGVSGQLVFLENAGETATVNVNVKETGMYTLKIATYTPYGAKTHNLLINDVDQGQISFVENKKGVVETEIGKFKLNAGDNTITVKSSWGWRKQLPLRKERFQPRQQSLPLCRLRSIRRMKSRESATAPV